MKILKVVFILFILSLVVHTPHLFAQMDMVGQQEQMMKKPGKMPMKEGGMGQMGEGMFPMGPSMGRRTVDPEIIMRFSKRLELNESQINSLKGISSRYRKEAIRKNADLRIGEMELDELQSEDKVNIQAIEKKIRQIEALRGDIKISIIKMQEEVKNILTPEQQLKLKTIIQERRDEMKSKGRSQKKKGDMKIK